MNCFVTNYNYNRIIHENMVLKYPKHHPNSLTSFLSIEFEAKHSQFGILLHLSFNLSSLELPLYTTDAASYLGGRFYLLN